MSRINKVEVHVFQFDAKNLGAVGGGGVGALGVQIGAKSRLTKYAVTIMTDNGLRGEYVTHWVGSASALGGTLMLAPYLIGREAEQREVLFDDLKREARQFDHMGHGPLDIALWDLHGKKLNASVSEMLGGYRKRLPTYASTYMGDHNDGLNSKEAFADFAADYRSTASFTESVDRLQDRLADPVADRVLASLRIAREVGGTDLGVVLRTLSALLREDARTRGEIEGRQSWTVSAARLAVAAPWITLAVLCTRPEAVRAYSSAAGGLVLLSAAIVTLLAYRAMLRIGRLPGEPRLAS